MTGDRTAGALTLLQVGGGTRPPAFFCHAYLYVFLQDLAAAQLRRDLVLSPTVTRLVLTSHRDDDDDEDDDEDDEEDGGDFVEAAKMAEAVRGVGARFPALRELDLTGWVRATDEVLDALMPPPPPPLYGGGRAREEEEEGVRELDVALRGLALRRARPVSGGGGRWPSPHLRVRELGVAALARLLPLPGVRRCTFGGAVLPSADAKAVEAVAAALRRWEVRVAGDSDDLFAAGVADGGGGASATISVCGEDRTALLATLGPLLAALPPSQFSGVAVTGLPGLSAEEMVRLGGALPGCMARVRLRLEGRLEGEACAALVPSLPATVGEVALAGRVGGAGVGGLDEQQLMLVCLGAARGVTLRAAVAEQAAGAAERVGRLMALLGRAHVVDVREL